MWLSLAFLSAFFLGCYDINKKMAVNNNAVIPVLFFNTVFCALLLTPLFLVSRLLPNSIEGTIFYVPNIEPTDHLFIILKSCLVLSSWIFGYYATKHLPLTLTGPINATRPVITLVGAMLIFGERLNPYQWIGVLLTIFSIFLLSASGRKEGIHFNKNKWILFIFLAAILGSASGLYDKHLMQTMSSTSVQFWYNLYQSLFMLIILFIIWYPQRTKSTPFKWRWNIIWVSVFLTLADFVYFYALTNPQAMISIVSMVRRSSVLISFIGGVLFFNEKNLKGKVVDLLLIIIGMFFLYLGTK